MIEKLITYIFMTVEIIQNIILERIFNLFSYPQCDFENIQIKYDKSEINNIS